MLGASSRGTSLVSRLEQVPSRLEARSEAIAASGVYVGAHMVFSVVVSHYDDIDLSIVGQGFTTGHPDEELDTIELAVAPTAMALAAVIPLQMVLQLMADEEE